MPPVNGLDATFGQAAGPQLNAITLGATQAGVMVEDRSLPDNVEDGRVYIGRRASGYVDGRRFTDYVNSVRELKRAGDLEGRSAFFFASSKQLRRRRATRDGA